MVDNHFDRISRLFAERRLSRRQVLATGGAVAAIGSNRAAWGTQPATRLPATPEGTESRPARVIVVGAGVIGLASAIVLQEAGFDVTIWAAEVTPGTTSDKAAAFWYPFHVLPIDEASVWGELSFKTLSALAGQPGTGVAMEPTTILFEDETDDPPWAHYIPDFHRPTADELPDGYVTAYGFTTPMVEMPIYMAYLMERFRQDGGTVVQRLVISLEEALAETRLVVNCTGLGSRSLVGDDRLFPIRGQLVRIARPDVDPYVMLGEGPRTGLAYVVHRSEDVILGGTDQEGNWSLAADPDDTEAILERAARIAPEIAGAEVLGEIVGIRPGRDAVRLEAEAWDAGVVIHCYGHGGGGVSLSWGCAQDVVALVMEHATRRSS
jgi:D-amino-acid oxidase